MKSAGIIERLDDTLNPIVVKELRQAVQSRFVSWVLFALLLLQLLAIGVYLMVVAAAGQIESIDFQAGRSVFAWLQGILLATCMLFLPLYAGIRLAAEHSDVNTDLLFITTLPPRAIISGKLVSSIVIALLIFSACTPFMAFTYFLRGIDWPSIILIITGDFLVVIVSVQIMLFLAVVPANRLLKAFLGLIGFGMLVGIFITAISASMVLLWDSWILGSDRAWFWISCAMLAVGIIGYGGLFFTWSVALISPPSSNRAFPVRLYTAAFWLVTGALAWWASDYLRSEVPFAIWAGEMYGLGILSFLISVNERENWTPRMARSIPRAWWARPFAFVLFSGAAGGIVFAALLFGLTALASGVFREMNTFSTGPFAIHWDSLEDTFRVSGILALYLLCYGLTAVFIRVWLLRSVAPSFTWIIMLGLLGIGSIIPFLLTFAFVQRFDYGIHYSSMLANPVAAMIEVGDNARSHRAEAFVTFAVAWGAAMVLLNLPWFIGQVLRFRPPAESASSPNALPASALTVHPMDQTRTAPST